MHIEVIWKAFSTIKTDKFTCKEASSQIFPDGRGIVSMIDGHDETGKVLDATYQDAIRIIRRP